MNSIVELFSKKKENLLRIKFISVLLHLRMLAEKTFLYMTGAHLFRVYTTIIHQGQLNTVHQEA